jgi:threonine synthase
MNKLICTLCHAEYPLTEPIWRCRCGGLLDIAFQPTFDKAKIQSRPPGLWRYREAIPLPADAPVVSFGEGFTPLVAVDFAGRPVWVKQDQLFPTGSYKDRGATVLISQANALGIRRVVEDSSGNAGCAIAAYSARAGIECSIYVPEDTSPGKLAQIRLYGAQLNRIPGSREDTAAAVMAAAQTTYYASHSWNPFFFHGTKTFAFEVCEQLGWRAPDTLVLPAGNGTLLLGAALGFRELFEIGVTNTLPKLVAVQSENCAPLEQAFTRNLPEVPKIHKRDTLAEGIAIAEPVRGMQIVDAVRRSGGTFITVSDAEIQQSLRAICRQGFYIEPTSAATTAGVTRYLLQAAPDECIVSVFTGHGLKSTEKMMKMGEEESREW